MKTGIFTFSGVDLPVNIVSFVELKDLMSEESFELFVSRVITFGGFWSAEVTAETIQVSIEMLQERASEDFMKGVASAALGHSIFCVKEMATHLTEQELCAIFKHEEGHIKLGHSNRPGIECRDGIMIDEDIELEADEYAALAFGKESVRSALCKIVQRQAELCSRINPEKTKEEYYDIFLSDSTLKNRLDALI